MRLGPRSRHTHHDQILRLGGQCYTRSLTSACPQQKPGEVSLTLPLIICKVTLVPIMQYETLLLGDSSIKLKNLKIPNIFQYSVHNVVATVVKNMNKIRVRNIFNTCNHILFHVSFNTPGRKKYQLLKLRFARVSFNT